ncbi:MAG: Dabb family protein, partial [Pseudonocardiaceae bacterium]
MIRHVVTFTWKPETTPDQIRFLAEGLASLPSQIAAIADYSFGPDVGLVEGNADFALVAEFADTADHGTYMLHPAHLAVIAERLKPIL